MKAVVLAGFTALIGAAVFAEPVSLTGEEIAELLTDNTAVGNWSGTDYRQYFAASGSTTYMPETGRTEWGSWRVNYDKNLYESEWSRPGWAGYGIARDGETLFWVESDGNMQAFTVVEGKQLKF